MNDVCPVPGERGPARIGTRTAERPGGHPAVIQGGMGVGVSGWRLARAVARTGQLGVVSGVALDVMLARRLQQGDPDGHLRRALASFPFPDVVERILARYYVAGGIGSGTPYKPVPRLGLRPHPGRTELTVAGNYAEVFLAREGHGGPIGVNYLEKIQMATPAAAYGAMLAGVDYVLMGAGIPSEIPALLDALAEHRPAQVTVTVAGADTGTRHTVEIHPHTLYGTATPAPLTRPRLLAIVSSDVLATYLARRPETRPDGFVLEGPVAGGHSAPPRGRLRLTADGEPEYGPRDHIDLAKVAALGLPFWLAGGYAGPRALADALAAGATGIQVGTAFALCRESGLDDKLRRTLLDAATHGTLTVRNDPHASPTGFPFKVADIPGTMADPALRAARPRLCDLGHLRTPYVKPGGAVGYRCPAEPVDTYTRKGRPADETVGRTCLCNGLVAAIGLGQHRPDGYAERPLLTLGQDLAFLRDLPDDHTAADVIAHLLGGQSGVCTDFGPSGGLQALDPQDGPS
ncbi:NAD(P)H-dependent flavin oxidoreductase YrpB, nitropropane dioxygenase family [Sinosporangium album]|uniref:NAD(P)H-dependent flavin oxidoreductase YrpB, nitropropane dioxygenase family n=1 Tax=Sinosporangium album TaxID=504805 RepID=A0A1G8G362_9ACTN|nr:nitronate monooxygenase [Sinosporangium album]SDH88740.1 NAD(P)H-dependent flavin oxidoreductase YrpB, nitropropane dioxygenase family [Sinosporangium album]